jgi:hypothetical protein
MASNWEDSDYRSAEPALRAADAAATKDAERKRAARWPIWVDRPRGSYRWALGFLLLTIPCLTLVLYDLGVLWRATSHEFDGSVTLVQSERPALYWTYVAIAYDGMESVLRIDGKQVTVAVGDRVTVVVHSRYSDRHVQSMLTANRTPLYEEPEHDGLSVNGMIGMAGAAVFGVLTITQVRLARRQRARDRAWAERHEPPASA